ncbi:MAG: SAM-dependent methyltransferase [Deltaproteobacteria bacterium]|nr:MAG: SAM-dependent methyltransferase [Deltaproteobacteria bacterium]
MAPIGRNLLQALTDYHRRTIHVPRVRRVAQALAPLITEAGGAHSLLDVGCGDGTIAATVGRTVGAERVVGLDVALRDQVAIDAYAYDGGLLPFDDDSFDVVLLADVLHHATDPLALMRECLRVATVGVALKDHLAFGPLSARLLTLMDHVGNAAAGVAVRGRYFALDEWFALVRRAGGRLTVMRWPLQIHDLPWRLVTRSELQFAALIEHAEGAPTDFRAPDPDEEL